MSPSYAAAMSAAHDAAAGQHYPQGALYVVATPIGNLADISLRALQVLRLADSVACEDTRHAGALLRGYGIEKEHGRLMAVHEHNEAEAAHEVLRRLGEGQRVALVSDAGTPAVSDPGNRLVAAVHAAKHRVVPIPGASSVTAALSVAGTLPLLGQPGFVFVGFLPTRASERELALQELRHEGRCSVLLEAPHRIESLASALAQLGDRGVTVGRELTKQFEEVATMSARELPGWLGAHAQRLRGEFVVVLHPHVLGTDSSEPDRVLAVLLEELPLKTAVKLALRITGAARNDLYAAALAQRGGGSDREPA